ncbi:MAG: GyrI-like domain-containing protein [Methylosarcina sp.]
MKVMVMVKASKSSEAGELPSEELLAAMGRFNEELVNAGILLAGEGLQPSSKGVRVRFSGNARTVMDGPFIETKELVAGYWLWQVQSMEEAIEWVKRCPNPMPEESDIEIRPLFEADNFGEVFTPALREQEAGIRAKALGLGPVRFENQEKRLIAGLKERYTLENRGNIPLQWRRFVPNLGNIPGQQNNRAYGVCQCSGDGCGFDYLTGVEVSDIGQLPPGFSHVRIPEGRYAVFTHSGHVSLMPQTMDNLWMRWVPDCGLKIADSPSFERYTEEFNPATGMGGIEIALPLAE